MNIINCTHSEEYPEQQSSRSDSVPQELETKPHNICKLTATTLISLDGSSCLYLRRDQTRGYKTFFHAEHN